MTRRKVSGRTIILSIPFAIMSLFAAQPILAAVPPAPFSPLVIETGDVARFYRLYDAANGHPTAQDLQERYINEGSLGLHHLADIRKVTGESIAKAIALHPEIYMNAKRCMAPLPSVRIRVRAALVRLHKLYPAAKFPPVTIAVSRGKPVGVADSKGVIIGLEALCAINYLGANVADRFVHTITHEYTHVQQALQAPALYDDPRPTVLQASLIEGAADFTAALLSGEASFRSPYAPEDKADASEIEERFVKDEGKRDLSRWIDNGTLTDPGDLGYWVGYRIVKSYYEHAADKRKALRSIIEMKDPKSFLAGSGWYPGINLN